MDARHMSSKLDESETTNIYLRDKILHLKQELENEKNNSCEITSKMFQTENAFKELEKEKIIIELKLKNTDEEISRLKIELDTVKTENSKAYSYAKMYVTKLKEFEAMYIKVQSERKSVISTGNSGSGG